jgi:integrase
VATIERRQRGGRRSPVRWRVRWRDASGRERSKSFDREDHARRYRARLEGDLAAGTWIDPALARVSVAEWAAEWRTTVVDVRPSSLARLEGTVRTHVLPEWGDTALSGVSNADVRAWAARLYGHGYSPSTVRKAVFALRRILDAAVADRRLTHNAAENVPMPVEEPGEQRYLTAEQVERVANSIEPRFRAMVLVAAYGGLRFGELSALRRSRVDVLRGRVQVAETLVQVGADLSFGPPKTRKGRRTVPLPRRVMDELADHLDAYVPATTEAVVFTGVFGQPLRREWFRRTWWLPAVAAAGLDRLRFHDLRHTYVSLLIRAGANPKEVSTWAGHSTVAFTLDRYGHLYDDADDSMPDRLDALLHPTPPAPTAPVLPLPTVSEASR